MAAYDYSMYGSYSQDPEFQALQSSFASAFGSSFPTFSYEAYQADPGYREGIKNQIFRDGPGSARGRTEILAEMVDFFERKQAETRDIFEETGGAIDVSGIYGDLSDDVRKVAERQLAGGRAELSRTTAGAQDQAREAIAGTGLGRSGVQAGTARQIAERQAGAFERLGEATRARQAEAETAIAQRIADLTYSEELRQRGMSEETIRSAIQFQRLMTQMETEYKYQQALQEKDWWDYLAPVLQIGGYVAGSYAEKKK
jgi:hypothetical protein